MRKKEINPCLHCGAYDEDFGCTMPSIHKWYACDIEARKEENIKKLEEYVAWVAEQERNKENEKCRI